MEPQDQTFFDCNLGSITAAQQQRLHESTVTVIGCGGLGCFVIEELARMGVGRLCITDPDRFSTSNINRQLYGLMETTGRFKVEVAGERLDQIHGQTTVVAAKKKFQDAMQLLFENTEVVVDCLDTPGERLKLSEICKKKRIRQTTVSISHASDYSVGFVILVGDPLPEPGSFQGKEPHEIPADC